MGITFVRHAESTSNVAGRWQGHGDAPLSERGVTQARALGKRLQGRAFNRVVASDLSRAAETARAVGAPLETDPEWREVDVGDWEGLTRDEVTRRFPDQIEALRRGESIPIGGGESWTQLHARIDAALDRLRAGLDDDARVLVVSHGGVIHGLVAGLMGLRDRRPRPIGRLANASMTTIRFEASHDPELIVYNDAAHLNPLGRWARERHEAGDTVVTLVAHDEPEDRGDATRVAGGRLRSNGPLLDVERLGGWYAGPEHTYAGGGGELRDAAAVLAERLGAPMQRAPEASAAETIATLAARHRGERIALVMETARIADYAAGLFGHRPAAGPRVGAPWHTGVSHLVVTEHGETFADYNLGPHLAS